MKDDDVMERLIRESPEHQRALAEVGRLEDLILAAWYASQDVHLLVVAEAIRERRKA